MPQVSDQQMLKDYLAGRIKFPTWFHALKQKPYSYPVSGSVTTGSSATLSVNIQSDSYFIVEGLSIVPGLTIGSYENATVQLADTTTAQPWSNSPVPLRDIAGRGDNPKYFSKPNILRPSSTLNITIANNIGTSQTFFCILHGRKVYGLSDEQVAILTRRMWFQYVMTLPAVTSGQTGIPTTMNIFNESDFLCDSLFGTTIIQFVVNTASAGATSSEILMQLRDQSSDNSFFASKTPARNVVGSMWAAYKSGGASFSNGRGFKLQRPFFIRRNGSILGEFDNQSATDLAANTAYVTFEGIRIFDQVS